jgi:hypothetical protein
MAKKLSLLLAAVAVLAVAVPAMANAAVPTLRGVTTHSPIAITTPPETIRGTGTNVEIHSPLLGSIKCSTITLEGTLTVNDMTNGITGSNTGQASPPTTDCTNGTNTVNVTNVKLTDLKSSHTEEVEVEKVKKTVGVVEASFTAEVDVGTKVCTFTGTNVKTTYSSGATSLSFSGATGITGAPSACGATGNTLTGSFLLELASTGEHLEAFF